MGGLLKGIKPDNGGDVNIKALFYIFLQGFLKI